KALVRLLEEQRGAGRSLGTGDELQEWLGRSRTVEPADLARTACAAIAHTIVQASAGCDRLVLAGGGVLNRALMAELKERAGIPVQPSDTLGVPAAWREAMAWAVLGALSQDRVPVTLPQVTGVAKAPISGCWTLP
ncbi:MAG: anhydro-N-acetylmuramic acid kinase, partial [Planctomycetes bacterium]|nr:anhydro-N-acetylmuramic acid kinase [Planctomycetota bacterium]